MKEHESWRRSFVAGGSGLCGICDKPIVPGQRVVPNQPEDQGPLFGDDYFHETCWQES